MVPVVAGSNPVTHPLFDDICAYHSCKGFVGRSSILEMLIVDSLSNQSSPRICSAYARQPLEFGDCSTCQLSANETWLF